jgi:hypothetical protein
MSAEVSYCSRFFAKFVEIIAAGLASAITAYLLDRAAKVPVGRQKLGDIRAELISISG